MGVIVVDLSRSVPEVVADPSPALDAFEDRGDAVDEDRAGMSRNRGKGGEFPGGRRVIAALQCVASPGRMGRAKWPVGGLEFD